MAAQLRIPDVFKLLQGAPRDSSMSVPALHSSVGISRGADIASRTEEKQVQLLAGRFHQ